MTCAKGDVIAVISSANGRIMWSFRPKRAADRLPAERHDRYRGGKYVSDTTKAIGIGHNASLTARFPATAFSACIPIVQ
jgi:hypothetical protein